MESPSFTQEEDGRFASRTLSDISIASNASGKAQHVSSFGAPRHMRVKFLCSHGGKIMPRPSDRRLRYVGGETRMMSVPRHIQFKALQLKLAEIYGPDVTLKYQLPEEDLDALVSVSSDEDLENMMEECDRLDAMEGSSRLRIFVFPPSDHDAIDFNDISDPKVSEHRYVEAVNTIQMDASLKQSDTITTADFYKNSSGLQSTYAFSSTAMQERASVLAENLQMSVFPPESFVPPGNLLTSKFPARNNAMGQIVLPPRAATARQWNEPASTQHVNSTNFQGAPASLDEFPELESGESASSSTSSQHDHHRHRWASNCHMQSHLEPSAYRIEEDHFSRSEYRDIVNMRVPGEAADSIVHATSVAPILTTKGSSEISRQNFETGKVMENSINEALEDEPLSPGALLQRQLLADHDPSEVDSRPFRKDGSQSSLDGDKKQQIPNCQLLHEKQQVEQLSFHNPAQLYVQEGVLASVPLLLDSLKFPGKVHPLPQEAPFLLFPTSAAPASLTGQIEIAQEPFVIPQPMKLQEASLFPPTLPHVEYTKLGHNNGGGNFDGFADLVPQAFTETPSAPFLHAYSTVNNNTIEIDSFSHRVHPSTTGFSDQRVSNGLDSGVASQGTWLGPDNVSFPVGESVQMELSHQSRVHKDMIAPLGITNNQLVVAGLSLLDQPVEHKSNLFSTTISELKVNQDSAMMIDCSTIDIISDVPTSALPLSCCLSQPSKLDDVAPPKLDPMAKLGREVADNIAGLSLKRSFGDSNLGIFQGADSLKQPLYQENVACFNPEDGVTKFNTKANFDITYEQGAATAAEAMQPSFPTSASHKEVWDTKLQLELEQQTAMVHISHEQDVNETGSILIEEKDMMIENIKSEIEEEDTFKSATDRTINAAAIAETEAIARGLQTIRNFDLEELKELGSGTFGTVYHGKWRGSDVAIKRIKSSCFTGRPSERERLIADFWQEAFILGQLHHPNVVAFYGVVPDGPDGTLATVTEFMVNGSLKQALQKKDRVLDRRKRLLIAMDAAFGMEYLHKKNVVHFDLKCENLLVNLRDLQRPICKVGDLGLSKVKQQTMISGGVRGTLPWMAPELLNGSSSLVSEKVDVFSFGIVLWELLTGDEPYASMHYGAIIGGIVTNTLRPPVPTWCDAAWRSLMEACWAADPAERPSFSEIASSLRAMEATLTAKGQGQAPVVVE